VKLGETVNRGGIDLIQSRGWSRSGTLQDEERGRGVGDCGTVQYTTGKIEPMRPKVRRRQSKAKKKKGRGEKKELGSDNKFRGESRRKVRKPNLYERQRGDTEEHA